MGKGPIYIRKYNENPPLYCYFIKAERWDNYEFYIQIDQEKKTVSFFLNADFKNPIGKIDFNTKESLIAIKGIHIDVSNLVAYKAYKAILEDNFPIDMSIIN